MSRPPKQFKEVVREWAKTARRGEIEGVCDVLANALAFRTFGVEDDPEDVPQPKRGRPVGSKNRPKEQARDLNFTTEIKKREAATESAAD